MVAYTILVILLIKWIKASYTDVTQLWYVDNASAICTFDNIGLYFNLLKHFVQGPGYYPKPSKRFLIVHLDHHKTRKEFGLCYGFKICMSARYLGDFIGDDKYKCEWLKYHTSKWEKNPCGHQNGREISPGELCSNGLCNPIVMAIFQCVTKDTGDAFARVEKILWETYLPRLLFGKSKSLPPIAGTSSMTPVNKSSLCLQ